MKGEELPDNRAAIC